MRSARPLLWIALPLALVGIAVLLWWRSAQPTPAPVAPAVAEAAEPAAADAAADAHDDHGHGHDHGAEAPNIDLRPRYFEAPSLADAGRFAAAETPLLVEPSCRGNRLLAPGGGAESRLQQLYAVDAKERFPQDLFYRSLIQFWRQGDSYYQLSAIWDIGIPPTYQLRLFRSSTPQFDSGTTVAEALPDAPEAPDAAAAADYLAQITAQRVADGAQLGLHMVEAEWPGTQRGERARATFANGRAAGWSFTGGYCAFDAAAAALRCRCPGSEGEDADAKATS
jgi:hypothetical protein